MSDMQWSLYNLWNESLDNGTERPMQVRDYIWASEIGGAYIDRYLKMKAIPFSNPPNPRSKRKFEAGNIWESIITYVLSRAGILVSRQDHLAYQYPNLMKVTGKLDCKAGGKPDYEKAKALIGTEFNWLPEFISRATMNIVKQLSEKYPDGLLEIILEIKSCSSFMFDIYERTNTASQHHKLQLFHYLKATNMPEGHIVYVCKDDARLLEIGILNPSEVEDDYKADIEQMTKYFNSGEEPPKEKFILFDDEFGRFSANWKVAYSQYLKYLYGFENQFAFDNTYKPIVERWNRVLGRIKKGDKMTDKNMAAILEMGEAGFNIEEIKKNFKGIENGTDSE
jgi:hypothetical protein